MRRPPLGQNLFVLAIEFVAVPVALADFRHAVGLAREAAFGQLAGIRAQAHGAAQLVDAFQFAQFVDHAIGRGRIEFGGIGVLQSADVARELDHHGLHAQTNSEVRNLALARVADGW